MLHEFNEGGSLMWLTFTQWKSGMKYASTNFYMYDGILYENGRCYLNENSENTMRWHWQHHSCSQETTHPFQFHASMSINRLLHFQLKSVCSSLFGSFCADHSVSMSNLKLQEDFLYALHAAHYISE
jgi:hypothetical protein